MNKTVILTGASGFIGRHCIPLLIKKDFEVHALTSKTTPPLSDQEVSWHTVDLLNPEHIHTAMEVICPTHLLHFAWYTDPGRYWSSPENNKWLDASLNLVREFIRIGGSRIVGAGTCAEYEWEDGYCFEYLTPLKPQSLYGISKLSLYQISQELLKNSGIEFSWGRIFSLFGPFENRKRLVPSIITALLQEKPAPCTVGSQIRDYLFVEDVAEAFVKLLDSSVSGPFNIASGKPVSVREIIELIGKKTGHEDLIRYGEIPISPSEASLVVADNRRLVHEVGWKQDNDLETGIDKTISWWADRLSDW